MKRKELIEEVKKEKETVEKNEQEELEKKSNKTIPKIFLKKVEFNWEIK